MAEYPSECQGQSANSTRSYQECHQISIATLKSITTGDLKHTRMVDRLLAEDLAYIRCQRFKYRVIPPELDHELYKGSDAPRTGAVCVQPSIDRPRFTACTRPCSNLSQARVGLSTPVFNQIVQL